MSNHLAHALAAIWYPCIGRFGWPTMDGRLAQYHRAKALPAWATSFSRSSRDIAPVDITVVITCFNYGEYLESAVNSVVEAALFDARLNVEMLIVDDGSTDNSFSVAKALLQSCPLPISIIRPWWNVGVSKARNLSLSHARGDFVFILDADNTLAKDSLSNLYQRIIAEKSDATYGPIRRVLPGGEEHSWVSNAPFDPAILRQQGPYIDAMALIRKTTLVSLGGYNVNLLKIIGGWEDYDLWLRLADDQYKVSFCKNAVIGNYLFKSNSMAKRISYKDAISGLNLLRTAVPSLEFKQNEKLIFDLGFHQGEDTSHYLASGFNVVAIEADPNLYRLGLKIFAKEINEQRLVLINAAAVAREKRLRRPQISFFPHSQNSLWGSADIDFVHRNTYTHKSPHEPAITIDTISLEEVVEKYGCPIFLKIDIEGMDAVVVEDLDRLPAMPEFVSWETGKKSLCQVLHTHLRLFGLGYRKFRIVQQMFRSVDFPPHSSGPMPSRHPSKWRGILSTMFAYTFLFIVYKLIGPNSIFTWAEHHGSSMVNTLPRYLRKEMNKRRIPFPGWFDSHAALPKKRF
jgi:FkbM family methyltransferase